MANVLAPFGFMPVRRLDGAAWTGNQSHRKIASSNTNVIYQGDVVVSNSSGYIDIATPSSAPIAGVFVGCAYLSTSQNKRVFSNRWPGADTTVDADAYIIDDPWCVFLAQSWSASTNTVTLANNMNNVKINTHANNSAVPAGNNLTGISGMVIDADNIATTSTYPFRIVGVPGLTEGSLGAAVNGYDTTTIYNVALVAFNNQDFKQLTGV